MSQEPERKNKFITYAVYRIKGAVLGELRSRDFLSRDNSLFLISGSLGIMLPTLSQSLWGMEGKPETISPGATSFGMFNNEFDRGDQFRQMVLDLP